MTEPKLKEVYKQAKQSEEIKNSMLHRVFDNKKFRYIAMTAALICGVIMGYANILGNLQLFEITALILAIIFLPFMVMYVVHIWKIDRLRKAIYKQHIREKKEQKNEDKFRKR